ncbi:MAG: ATP synthase subunit I [Syntrophobacteraceae bacterium]
MAQTDESDKLLQRIELASAILLVSLTGGAAALFSWSTAFGVFIGGAIVVISFQILKWQLRRTLQRPGKLPSRAAVFLSYYLRFLAVLFVVFLVMYFGLVKPFPILVGLSVMVLSIMLVGVFEFFKMKKEES